MAATVSNEYDHIDIVAGNTTNRHYLKDRTARESINTINDTIVDIEDTVDDLSAQVEAANTSLAGKVDGWFIEDNVLYLTSNGVVIGDGGISGIGGGGGGGGGSGATMTMTNGMEWLATTIRHGATCPITISWSSTIDDVPTGNGTMKVIVNNAIRTSLNVSQGNVTVDVGEYLNNGSNTVKLTVSDAYGGSRSLIYTINSVLLQVTSSFDTSSPYTDEFYFPYVPIGSVEKTVHFKLDGTEQQTVTTSVSNRQLSYLVPAQTHGAHTIECWYTATINSETVSSNHVVFEYMFAVANTETPIITTQFTETSVTQYSTVSIPYRVYDPTDLQAQVSIYENNVLKTTLTVGRELNTYSYRALTAGNAAVKFVVGQTEKSVTFTVTSMNIDVEAETDGLQLYLTSQGRSNAEQNPGTWSYGNISATMTDFNFTSDGWQQDADGSTVLRIGGDARVTIPYQIFASDFRAGGRTIEIEFETSNVLNYDTPVISCYSGGRGIQISSQMARIASEQSEIFTQFKENEHIRIAFVVQKRTEQRLILCYINGIVSGVVQYPDNDDFSQMTPVNISFGCADATLDIYNIRIYDHDLNRFQILDNWVADTPNGFELVQRYTHNDIFDQYGNIVIAQLPNDLPYMILNGTLPTYKGNKLTISGEYVDPLNPSKSFTFEDAQIDVQGTSSQYYARKNYKIKFNGGFTNNGTTASKYAINDNAIPVKTFTFKADVASSEGANNVELARLYNEACPYKTPYQKANAKVRQGIDGFPIVIFHNDGNDTTFLGKYNFNNDKGTEEVFGFTTGDESWEIKNNTSNRVIWKSDDYTGDDWLNDFEARYPEDNTNSDNLKALATWLKSTDQTQATGDALAESVSYTDGEGQDAVTTTYTNDTAAYRLAKFKHELADHVEMDSILFYYLFTELFLMVDSRAKNAFPSLLGGDKWCILPYDFDTAIGINNEGSLTFSYNLEDTDHTAGGADVFNGQQSVLWVNLRQAFPDELRAMYQSLRSNNKLSYTKIEGMFENHQGVWPEAIFNEDAQYKYIDPLIDDGDGSYLAMLQGSKEAQRKWWLYNRFRYIDSKYNAGDALTDYIQVRGYANADITVIPYADIYPAVKYGSYLVTTRGTRNVATTLANPLPNTNDTEIYIYSASQLLSVGDLSGLKVGFADFSRATNLQALKIGDDVSSWPEWVSGTEYDVGDKVKITTTVDNETTVTGYVCDTANSDSTFDSEKWTSATYTNGNLETLTLGNNKLLKSIDVRNCTALTQSVDLSGCTNIEDVYFDGTSVTGVQLPNGGVVKKLHLPGTITNLTVLNQTGITEFECPDYSNITTLRIENSLDQNDILDIIDDMAAGGRVRLYNFHWEMNDGTPIISRLDKLDTMRGLDQDGNNTEKAQIYGTIHIPSTTGATVAAIQSRYPGITITYDTLISNLYYYDFFGTTLLHTDIVANGGNGSYSVTPSTPSSTAQYTFNSFLGWALAPESSTANVNATKHVEADRNVYAAFSVTVRTYTATFKLDSMHSGTGSASTIYTQNNVPYGTTPVYGGTTPESALGSDYVFDRWDPELTGITGNTTYTAQFKDMAIPLYKYLKSSMTEYVSTSGNDIGRYAFYGRYKLKTVTSDTQKIDYSGFYDCGALEYVDLTTPGTLTIGERAFMLSYELKRLYIRSNYIATIQLNGMEVNHRCMILVPDNLVDAYKSSTNWANYADMIYGISEAEENPVWDETEIEDDISTIKNRILNGTAASYYHLGQYKYVDFGSEGIIRMQIVGKNMRELANSSEKAQLEWMAMETLKTYKRYNPSLSAGTEGTGTLGGYDKSSIKTYLDTTIWDLVPTNWKDIIKETKIITTTYSKSSTKIRNEETTAKLRLPSYFELYGSDSSYESEGPTYSYFFNITYQKRRDRVNTTTGSKDYWLRSANNTSRAACVSSGGSVSYTTVTNSKDVVICFST